MKEVSAAACYNPQMGNIIALIAVCATIAASAGGLCWQIAAMESRLIARLDRLESRLAGMGSRLSKVETEVHSINDHLRHPLASIGK